MKSFIVCLVFVFTLILLSGCSKDPTKVLPSKDGKWNLKLYSKVTQTVSGLPDQVTESTCSGTSTFTDTELTLDFSSGSGCTNLTYKWSYEDDKITLTGWGYPAPLSVTEKSTKKEVWKLDYANGGTHTVQEWTFSR